MAVQCLIWSQARQSELRAISRWVLTFLFIGSGTLHLLQPRPFLQIVPPQVPWAIFAVAFSGIAEIAGGIGLAIPRLRIAAGWGLLLLLVCVFPANVYMAAQHIVPGGMQIPAWLLWSRLLLQPLLMWWVFSMSLSRSSKGMSDARRFDS